jgi:hypothetical protein
LSANVAVTVVPASATLVTQLPVPVQPVTPLHPVNVEPPDGVADSVTCVPVGMEAEQVVPQLMEPAPPFQDAVTTPDPLPAFAMLKLAFLSANVAVTVVAALIEVSVHVPVAFVQAPDQPVKLSLGPGVAVSVSDVPLFTFEMQDGLEQLTPVPVTVPVPTTCTVTG